MKKKKTSPDINATILSIVEHISSDITELNKRVRTLEKGQVEILDKLEPLSRAHDTDSELLVEHGRRIVHIEKHVGIRR